MKAMDYMMASAFLFGIAVGGGMVNIIYQVLLNKKKLRVIDSTQNTIILSGKIDDISTGDMVFIKKRGDE